MELMSISKEKIETEKRRSGNLKGAPTCEEPEEDREKCHQRARRALKGQPREKDCGTLKYLKNMWLNFEPRQTPGLPRSVWCGHTSWTSKEQGREMLTGSPSSSPQLLSFSHASPSPPSTPGPLPQPMCGLVAPGVCRC